MKSNEVQLNCGRNIPTIGFGTYSYNYDEERTKQAVQMALKIGYRHFDTAKIYGSEPAVGKALADAIKDRTIEREDVFVTSKLWGSDHDDPVSALKETLQKLGMEYVDMYLVHWPVKLKPWVLYPIPKEEDFEPLDMETTWAGMEKCLKMGLCKGIGLSNFSTKKIQRLLDFASVHPAVNQIGYRHFDTAKIYGSEPAVGKALADAIKDGTIEREDVFVTSKLWGSDHDDPVSALKETLQKLGMEYVDMYLVHWPVKLKPWVLYPIPKEEDFEPLDMETTWAGMEKCLKMGLCKGIGLSNFSTKKIQRLLDFASVHPAVNQVEMHPMWRQTKLREFCGDHKIHVSAYMPLGAPGNLWGSTAVVDHPIIKSVALKHNATPAQVALRWGLSKGSSVIVKSFNGARMKENMAALDLKLDDQDLLEMEKMEEMKIARGDFVVNETSSPYKTIQDLWDDEI